MTGFFHVPSAFGVLEEKVIPALFQGKSSHERIRVWVAGCATGEEAYSVAILMAEYASTLSAPPTIEVFATDNDEEALELARIGVYPPSIKTEMSSVCLEKYFVPSSPGYAIVPEIKALVRFSSHDVLIDNSFQSFELITCRHLLAYLDPASQKQIVSFYHHSLKEKGFLFLGDAEFAEGLPAQFISVDDIYKIYRLSETMSLFKDGEGEARTMAGVTKESRRKANSLFKEVPREEDIDAAHEAAVANSKLIDEGSDSTIDDEVTEEYTDDVIEDAVVEQVEVEDIATSDEAGEPNAETDGELPKVDDLSVSVEDIYPKHEVIHGDFANAVKELIGEIDEEELPSSEAIAMAASALQFDEDEGMAHSDTIRDEEGEPVLTPVDIFSGEEVIQDASGLIMEESFDLENEDLEDEEEGNRDDQPGPEITARENDTVTMSVDAPEPAGDGIASESEPIATSEERQQQEEYVTLDEAIDEEALSQLHLDLLLNKYAPASLLIDRSFRILDATGRLDRVFVARMNHFVGDYLDKLPDVQRLQIEEAINRVFHQRDTTEAVQMSIPSITGGGDAVLEARYMTFPMTGQGVVHLLIQTEGHGRNGHSAREENISFFATPLADQKASNGRTQTVPVGQVQDEVFLRTVRLAPFPMLVHAEGGQILALSQPWIDLAGLDADEAPTISAWTKKVKGHRLRLKDSKLKEAYEKAGVVCISMRTQTGDAKLLAFHSYYMGTDRRGRKMTLTMAIDITSYPGHTGMGVMPESADFGMLAKKVFLANLSHEIRTPLTSMIGFADYLTDKLSGQDVQFARYISESGNRLLETLNAVLRIAAMDGHEPFMQPEQVDITAEAQGVLQLFKPHAEQFGISLKLIVEQPTKARLDRPAFRRILANLIGNAIKFTPDGEVIILVNDEDESVIVEIEDTGIGINDAFLPFVFDRFSQEAKGQARAYSGCGLGLAICRDLVESMGGTIQVETEVGVGSKFTVKLPKEPPGLDEPESIDLEPEDEEDADELKRILVVEDNFDTQELMLLILRDKYEVTIAPNVTETLKIANRQTFDAVLMDLNLGGQQTGFELLRELRTMRNFETVPVLAVSALPIGVIRKQLIREGFNGYIAKPFTRTRILDALDGILNLTA